MSHHSGGIVHVRAPWQKGVVDRAQHPVMWLVSTPLPMLQRNLLVVIASIVTSGKLCAPSQERLGEMLDRSRETIGRALAALVAQRLIAAKRRGRRLTNVYRLAHRIWQAITGRIPPYWKDRQLHLRYEAGQRGGLTPWRAASQALGYG